MEIPTRQSLRQSLAYLPIQLASSVDVTAPRSHLPEATASHHFLETQQTSTSPTGQFNCHRGQ